MAFSGKLASCRAHPLIPAAVCHDLGSVFGDRAPVGTYSWQTTTDHVRLSHRVPLRIPGAASFTLHWADRTAVSKQAS